MLVGEMLAHRHTIEAEHDDRELHEVRVLCTAVAALLFMPSTKTR